MKGDCKSCDLYTGKLLCLKHSAMEAFMTQDLDTFVNYTKTSLNHSKDWLYGYVVIDQQHLMLSQSDYNDVKKNPIAHVRIPADGLHRPFYNYGARTMHNLCVYVYPLLILPSSLVRCVCPLYVLKVTKYLYEFDATHTRWMSKGAIYEYARILGFSVRSSSQSLNRIMRGSLSLSQISGSESHKLVKYYRARDRIIRKALSIMSDDVIELVIDMAD